MFTTFLSTPHGDPAVSPVSDVRARGNAGNDPATTGALTSPNATHRRCNCDIGLFQPVGDVIVRRGGERDGWSAKTRALKIKRSDTAPRDWTVRPARVISRLIGRETQKREIAGSSSRGCCDKFTSKTSEGLHVLVSVPRACR
jgi:hypothetical protein